MPWIRTISFGESTGRLRKTFERIAGPNGTIDNILVVHSLRPHTLSGHMALYKSVLHHSGNALPKWFLETLGIHVSYLNGCSYCFDHHFAGLERLVDNPARSEAIRNALTSNNFDGVFSSKEASALVYAAALTNDVSRVDESFIALMRSEGLTDGEILEINQVVSYFAYANRTINGLGVTTDGDVLGLSPGDNDDADNWHHG